MRFYRLRLLIGLTAVLVLLLALAACGGGTEESAEQPALTEVAAPTEVVAPTEEVVPTDTPEPPPPTDTPEPEPTDTPEPTATSVPEVSLAEYSSEEAGLRLSYPEGWFEGGVPGFNIFASSEAALESDSPGSAGPVVLVVTGSTADFTSAAPEDAIDEVITEFDLGEDDVVKEGPTAVTINGQEGAYTIIETVTDTGDPLTAYVLLVINGDYSAIMVGAAPTDQADEYMDTFAAMAETIEVSEPTASVTDFGDTAGDVGELVSAGFLFYGDSVEGTLSEDGAASWEFIGLEDEVVDITVEPADDLDVVVDVLDESGASILDFPVDNSFGVEEILELTIPSSGTFTIVVSGFDGAVGDYTLRLAEAGSTSVASDLTGDLVYSEIATGSVDGTTESVWTFAAVGGEYMDITVSPTSEGLDVVVDVLDANGRSLLDEPVDASYDTEYIRTLPIAEDGVYTLAVSSFDGTAGDIEILIEESYLSEPASFIFASGELADAEEVHDFPFSAPADELVIAQVDPVEVEFDVVLQVYNEDTDELLDELDANTGFEELLFTVPEDGNYYFRVMGFEGSTGTYDITLVGSDLVTFETAVGDEIIGRFGSDGYIEYYIGADAGDTINLTATTEDDVDLILEIWDFDDNVLAKVDDGFSGEGEELSYTFEEDGLFIIRVSDFFAGGSGKFFLTID